MEILDMEGACEFLKLAKPTLYKFIRNGADPSVQSRANLEVSPRIFR